jgi:hypothetical protein
VMPNPPRYRSLLRFLFGAVIRSELTHAELRALARELRRGRLADELACMIDQASEHFEEPEHKVSDQVRDLERLIKEKRVSKEALANIIMSIDDRPSPPLSASARRMLQEFVSGASLWQIDKLRDTLAAASVPDPYLKGIDKDA